MKYQEPSQLEPQKSEKSTHPLDPVPSPYKNLFEEFIHLMNKANDDSLYNSFDISYMEACCRKEASIGKNYCDFVANLPFKPSILNYFEENGLGINHGDSIDSRSRTHEITIYW